MQIVLTDVLTCPRCGPAFGLIVLADRLENRRVIEGRLGCANCRESFEIRAGVADLTHLGPAQNAGIAAAGDPEEPVRLAALLGLADARGLVVLVGDVAALAGAVAELVPEVTVAATGAPLEEMAVHPSVNRLLVTSGLPLRDHSALAVAVGGAGVGELLDEAVRVARPGARIVTRGVPGAADHLRNAGLSVLLEEGDIVVATGRSGR